MVVQPKGERMKSKGMVLYMNRNTKTTTGYIVMKHFMMKMVER